MNFHRTVNGASFLFDIQLNFPGRESNLIKQVSHLLGRKSDHQKPKQKPIHNVKEKETLIKLSLTFPFQLLSHHRKSISVSVSNLNSRLNSRTRDCEVI
jgi:hypothetical protein